MKCPERLRVSQITIKRNLVNKINETNGELEIVIENQNFEECYKENCAAWDKENQKCRKE